MDVLAIVLSVACTVICCTGICLHASIIYLLHRSTSSEAHQKVILVHFSILEIVSLVLCQLVLYVAFSSEVIKQYIMLLLYGVGWPWVHVLILLTVDRFLRVYLSIEYDVYLTKRLQTLLIWSCYVVGILLDVAIVLMHILDSPYAAATIIRTVVFPVHGVVVIAVFLCTYSYIACKMYAKRRNSNDQPQQSRLRDNMNYFVPLFIVLAHLLFVIVPNLFYVFYPNHIPQKYQGIVWRLLWTINFTVDAGICILLNSPIRKKFIRIHFRRSMNRSNRINDM